MEAIDKLSSKIIEVFDYVTHSYLILFVAVIVIAGIIMYLGNMSSSNDLSNSPFLDTTSSNSGISILQIILFLIIVIILLWLLSHTINRLFGIDVIQTIKNIFSNQQLDNTIVDYDSDYDSDTDDISTSGNTGPSSSLQPSLAPKRGEEVFNVSNNKYTYNEAKAICKAYNSRLATYSEVENAYNAGGEWCNYGWSENQLALFPTQEATYNNLQKIKGHENDCGRPGVNGGFLDESLKFGVNCYGVKPEMDEDEKELMRLQRIYPKTKSEAELEKQADYWKEHLDEINVAPFNRDKWNRI
jgi:hypothetical protein